MPLILCPPYISQALAELIQEYGADPYFNYVTLLMHMDGSFIDGMSHNVINNNSTTQLSTSVKKFGSSSMYLDGTNTVVSIVNKHNTSASSDFMFGTGDFTVEQWIYPTALPTLSDQQVIWTNSPPSGTQYATTTLGICLMNTGKLRVQSAYSVFMMGTQNIPLNQWTHVALSRAGGVMYLFVNGVLDNSGTVANDFSSVVDLKIGGYSAVAEGQHFTGYIDEMRITKGIGRYTTAFTPPTSAFPDGGLAYDPYFDNNALLAHFNGTNGSTIFTDVMGNIASTVGGPVISTTQSRFGTGALHLNGSSGVRYSSGGSPNFTFGTGDFTQEAWVYPTSYTAVGIVVANGATTGTGGVSLYINASGVLVASTGAAAICNSGANIVPVNKWSHVACTRKGSTVTVWINGTAVGSASNAQNFTDGSCFVGYNNTYFYNGYIDEVRVTKGVARYTADFNPETAPFQDVPLSNAIENLSYDPHWAATVLLVRGNGTEGSAVFTDETGKTLGTSTATNSVTNSLFGTGSIKFTNKTDYVLLPTSKDFDLVGDFTVEAWVNPDTYFSSAWSIFDVRSAGATNASWGFNLLNVSGVYRPQFYATSSFQPIGTTTSFPLNTWTHFAVVRSGTTVTFYVNGVADATTGTSGAVFASGTNPIIGSKDSNLAGYGTKGMLDEVRITKGVARYTANFTPVRLPFPARNLDGGSFDPYAKSVVLHSHFEGSNGSTTIVDVATGKTPTLTGTPSISTADAKFGSSALRLTAGQHITYSTSTDFNIGSTTLGQSDYTAEMFIKLVAYPTSIDGMLFSFDGASTYNPQLFIWSDGNIYLRYAQSTGNIITPVAHGMSLNTWYHVALVRRGTLFTVLINGVPIASGASSGQIANESKTLRVGGSQFNGYIDELRVTKGVARYGAPFTPASAAFPEASAGNEYSARFAADAFAANVSAHISFDGSVPTDAKGNVLTNGGTVVCTSREYVDGGAGVFPAGSFACLKLPAGSAFAPGTGDFTVEAWVKTTATQVYNSDTTNHASSIWSQTTSGSNYFMLCLGSSDNLTMTARFLSANGTITGGYLLSGAWNHVAVVRKSGMIRIYVNGVPNTATANTIDFNNTTYVPTIGQYSHNSTQLLFAGLMDNVRYTKAARYDGHFIPSPDYS